MSTYPKKKKRKKGILTNFMALIPPTLLFLFLFFNYYFFKNIYATCAITRCRSALQSNVVRSFVGGGEEVARCPLPVAVALETGN